MKKQTLILLSPAFPADESPEESIWIPAKQRLVKCINQLYPDIEIIILAFRFPLKKEAYYWHGNLVIPFAGSDAKKINARILWLKVFLRLKKLKKEKNIAGLLSFWCSECAFTANRFAKMHHIKHLCWISGRDAQSENKFVRRIRPSADELVAMSDFLSDTFYRNHHIKPAHLIYNGLYTQEYSLQSLPRIWDIMAAGSLSPLKQYDIFVKQIAALKRFFPNIKACLCGNGSERGKIEKLIHDLDLEENITLKGEVPAATVFNLMQQTKVFLHPSSYEGFGNVCIEALYAGAQVVSFVKPVYKNINGWHVAKTEEEMTGIAHSLLCKDNASYAPVKPFDMEDSARMFMQLFLRP